MKRRKKRAMLFLALALLAGTWLMTAYMAGLDARAQAAPADSEAAGYALSIGTQRELTALSWAWNGETVNLRRDARGRWENAEDPDCPLDSAAVGSLTRAAASVTASMAVEGVTDLAQYGLDEPELVVMAAAGDTIVTYEVGNGTITGEYYLRANGGDTVYLENGGLASAFRTDLTALLRRETMPADAAEVTGLTVETEAQSYALRREGDGWLRTDGGLSQPLEEGPVRTLYELVLATDLSDCVGWDAGQAQGFDAPQGTVKVDYRRADGTDGTFTLEFGDYDGRQVYVRFAGSSLSYRTSAAALDALMYPDWNAMRPLRVLDIRLGDVQSLTVGRAGTTYPILRLTEEGTAGAVYSADGWVFDTGRMEAWLRKLTALTAEGTAPARQGRSELFTLELTLAPEEAPAEAAPAEEAPAETAPPEGDAETQEELAPQKGRTVSVSLWQYDSVHALCVTEDRGLLIPRETGLALAEELDALLEAP